MHLYYFMVVLLLILNYNHFATGDEPDKKEPTTGTKEDCSSHVFDCDASNSRRPVCGTDGHTYPSRCHLLRAQCFEKHITVAHKGSCAEGQPACLVARLYVMNAQANGGVRPAFVPRCRVDGSYAPVQCASGVTAGCWCVSPSGKPLPNTAVRNGRPDCSSFIEKSQTRRRASVRGQRNKKACSRADKVQFNTNLLKSFSGEYERGRSATGGDTADPKTVLEWKFNELDRDHNGLLQKPEYRGLRKLIKKVIKPRRCARAWGRGCDSDADGVITHREWSACILASPTPHPDHLNEGDAEPNRDYDEEEPPPDAAAVLPGSLMRGVVSPDGDSEARREDDSNDCLTDRQAVLDEQKAGGPALYVPECTGDGRYARAQCYRSTGYCWCVHQDTGKPIPGSSVKDRKPDCDSAPHHASPMRGCPDPIKASFLRDLIKLFITKMTSSTNGTMPGSSEMVKWGASREEQAATWTFVMLDKDKNKALERREWKAYHQLISNMEELRRCGKKLPRYCDVNHDSRISITEWLACLDVAPATSASASTTETLKLPPNPRRKGPNPLESILKTDD